MEDNVCCKNHVNFIPSWRWFIPILICVSVFYWAKHVSLIFSLFGLKKIYLKMWVWFRSGKGNKLFIYFVQSKENIYVSSPVYHWSFYWGNGYIFNVQYTKLTYSTISDWGISQNQIKKGAMDPLYWNEFFCYFIVLCRIKDYIYYNLRFPYSISHIINYYIILYPQEIAWVR